MARSRAGKLKRTIAMYTEMPEIEDAQCSKSMAPPPTAQTPGSNWLIFWLETPHRNTFRGTEAIFEFHPGSWDMGLFMGFWRVKSGVRKSANIAYFRLISQLLGWNSKIASVPLKVSPWGVSSQKISQFDPGVWAVGGVPSIFDPPLALQYTPTLSIPCRYFNSGSAVLLRSWMCW